MSDNRAALISPRLVLGLAIMVLGTLFLLDNMNVVDFDEAFRFWFWPLLLIGGGGWIVWRAFRGEDEPFVGPHSADHPGNDARASGADTLSALAFVGHVEKTSASKNFQGADLTAIMGGCTIDLSGADTGTGGAVVDAFAFWGSIEIIVPEDWVVTNKVLPLLGGSEDKSRAIAGASKQLLVRGTAIMGGVSIANHRGDS